ncbi:monocarboxylate transporter 12-like isoform X2 [Haliotis rubra]|uniref:monocarboxylate transporter 12-like isoform X2 n=1 Tax=Haliotis rubra TaxID=36100 RepID=UPI001EE5EBA5|nr:monocarboxylate transporter 12-like isoform X2 [Haliotis rubra]
MGRSYPLRRDARYCQTKSPVASLVINRYNCRVCTIIGGILILIGFTISAFVHSIDVLLITYGVIAGAGTGFSYCPAVVSLGYNFQKYLGITAGVSMTGAALGLFSGGPVIRLFIDNYGLSGTFLLMGGIGANMCACGMLFRPTKLERDLKQKRQESSKQTMRESARDGWQRYVLIFQNRTFGLYCVSIFSWNLAQSAIYLHLPFYAQSKGTSPESAAALFTGMGAFSLVARILTGLVVTRQEIDGLILHMGCLGMASITTFLFPLYSATYVGQMIYSSMLGFYLASPMVLLSPLTVELVGVDNLAGGIGVGTFVLGSGYLVGPPIAGFIIDSGASYDHSFMVAGCFLLVSSLVTLGAAALHGRSQLPVEPALFTSLTIIPPEAASNISLHARELREKAAASGSWTSEKPKHIRDINMFIDELGRDFAYHPGDNNQNSQPSEISLLVDNSIINQEDTVVQER